MAEAETWTCPGCAKVYPLDVRTCTLCRVTQVRPRVTKKYEREEKVVPKIAVSLPCVFPEVRFCVSDVWTSGCVVVVEQGYFLLSEKDGLRPQDVVKAPPAERTGLGDLSLFLPKASITRIVHDRFNGYFIETPAGKNPLRLSSEDAWRELDAVCDRIGVSHSP